MKRRRTIVPLAVAAFLFGGAATQAQQGTGGWRVAGLSGGPRTAAPVGCTLAWTSVAAPSPGSRDNFLHSITAVGSGNEWAAGSAQVGAQPATVIQSWNGSAWTQVSTPNVGTGANYLYGIAQTSGTDIWAVGAFFNVTTQRHRTLILHYNGTAWSVVASPNVGTGNNYLQAVEVIDATNVWAVGYVENDTGVVQTLILHYTGSTWQVVSSPNPAPSGNYLYGLSATSANDIWAVGATYVASATNLQTLILHYDGGAWTQVASPNAVANTTNLLMDVKAISSTQAFAVGFANGTTDFAPVVLQWNGTTWTPPVLPSKAGRLFGVDAVSASDVWGVGDPGLFVHWDGQSWQIVSAAAPVDRGTLFAVSGLASGEVHAVGYYTPTGKIEKTLAGFLCEATVSDTGFSASQASIAFGTSAVWHFSEANTIQHRLIDLQRMGLLDSGPRLPGASYAFTFLGAGTYSVQDTVSRKQMRINIAPTALPPTGGVQTTFTVTWATGAIPGFVFDVQIRRPGAGWVDWKTGVTTLSSTFTPDGGVGKYSFRARVRNLSSGKACAYSPAATVTVS
jgi:hypothetical protein